MGSGREVDTNEAFDYAAGGRGEVSTVLRGLELASDLEASPTLVDKHSFERTTLCGRKTVRPLYLPTMHTPPTVLTKFVGPKSNVR